MPRLSAHCVVCGVPLAGLAAVLLSWRGIGRNNRNPNMCTQCAAHLEEGRLVELTVLFADLSSFTAMTGRLGPEKTYVVVDAFLRTASGILTSHGATIDKYIGDAVMAFFNVPIARPDHAAAAVAAAEQVHAALPGLSSELGVELKASVGIATGYARVGRLGSDDPKDYSAIGDAVNQAARLQAQAKANEIVVSDRVYEKVAAAYPAVAPEQLVLKGFSQPTPAYRIKGAASGSAHDESWMRRRPAMGWGAVALALLGSGCVGKTVALTLTLAYGAGSLTALTASLAALDDSALREPLLMAAAIVSGVILGSLLRQWRLRKACMADNNCVEMTRAERRSVWAAAALAAVPLALVFLELLSHRFDVGMAVRRPIAQTLSDWLR